MTRAVMHLVRTNPDGRWHLTHGEIDLGSYDSKAQAEADGKRRGDEFEAGGLAAQLIVHREDGSIEREYTYGNGAEEAVAQ